MEGIGTLSKLRFRQIPRDQCSLYFDIVTNYIFILIQCGFLYFNGNNNNGTNFSYTVTSTPKVTVSPVFPSPTDDVTIDFMLPEQTLGSQGLSTFGVSTTSTNPKEFQSDDWKLGTR